MNKLALALITAVSVLCLTTLAFAGSLAPGASMSCNDAKSIKLASAGSHAQIEVMRILCFGNLPTPRQFRFHWDRLIRVES